ncbi:unnamed protein product [Durusdinium trenchii]|uniref:Guanylate-binding protein N-terminal domain-containing protein n=1 Tax=Durusdinium trenchii TaxID=1381693 RepID=A0ABP0J2B7_9DINO
MVCGRLRTGKSYLMNCLLRHPCFAVSSQARSFTKGVDLSSRLVDVEELGGKKGGPRVAFADLEGQGDKGLAQDLKIATPLLIVSKVVLLMEVCPGGPSSEAILESLQLLMMAGNCIAERKDRRGLFGCLHIVLRDCAQDEAECRSIIFDKEDEVNAETDQHAEAMQKRNDIRKSIEISFEAAPKVWCVPKLAEELKWGFDRLHNCATRVVHPVRKPGMLLVIDYYKHIVQICAELFAFSEALSSGCVQLVLARMWLQMTTRRPTGKAFLTRSMKSVLHSTVQLSVNVYSVQRWTARMHTNSFVFSHNFCIV